MFVQPSPCPSHSIQLYAYIIPTSLWSLKRHAIYDAAIPVSICIKLFTSLPPNSWPFRSVIQSPLPCHVVCDPGVPSSVFIPPFHWMHCLSLHMYAYTCTHALQLSASQQWCGNTTVIFPWWHFHSEDPMALMLARYNQPVRLLWRSGQRWSNTFSPSDCLKDQVNFGQD